MSDQTPLVETSWAATIGWSAALTSVALLAIAAALLYSTFFRLTWVEYEACLNSHGITTQNQCDPLEPLIP